MEPPSAQSANVAPASSDGTFPAVGLPRWITLSLILLATSLLGLQWQATGIWTPTHDEYWHLPIGYDIWRTGKFSQDRINPPLVRLWAAAPQFWWSPRLSEKNAAAFDSAQLESDFGDAFLAAFPEDARKLYRSGRMMIVLIGLAGCLLVAAWGRQVAGTWGMICCGLFWLTDPNLTAHAGLVTHDLAGAVAFVGVGYLLSRYLRRPTGAGAVQVGVAVGVAQLIKFTSLIWYPLLGIGFVVGLLLRRPTSRKQWTRDFAILLGVSLLVINLGYGFHGLWSPLSALPFASRPLVAGVDQLGLLSHIPVPLPADYLLGVDRLLAFMALPQPVYLNLAWSLSGFADYYFYCWWYKTPHVLQLSMLCGLAILLRMAWSDSAARQLLGITLPVLLVVVLTASQSANQLGYRYLLPIYPFFVLYAGCGWGWLLARQSPVRLQVLLGGLVLLCGLSLRHHPDHLAYFNELAGGPEGGRFLLVDSNLDWGQDLHRLREVIEQENLALTGLAYFGSFPPAEIGLEQPAPPTFEPQPGTYAVSFNFVQGRPHVIRQPDGSWRQVGLDDFGYFRFFEPTRVIGHSIGLYELTQVDIARLREARRRAGL